MQCTVQPHFLVLAVILAALPSSGGHLRGLRLTSTTWRAARGSQLEGVAVAAPEIAAAAAAAAAVSSEPADVAAGSKSKPPPCCKPDSSEASLSYSRDAGAPEQIASGDLAAFPLDVPDGGSLTICICNVGNLAFNGSRKISRVLPSLIGAVGNRAKVHIDVFNSWNAIVVAGDLTITGAADEAFSDTSLLANWPRLRGHGRLQMMQQEAASRTFRNTLHASGTWQKKKNKKRAARSKRPKVHAAVASLMPSLISGSIGNEVVVKISCKQSANVMFSDPQSTLRLSEGALVRSLVHVEGSSVARSHLDIHLAGSGNVAFSHGGEAILHSGTFVGSLLSCRSVVDSTLHMKVENVSNIQAKTLQVSQSSLMDSIIHVAQGLKHAEAQLQVQRVGNFKGERVAVVHAELVDEMVDCEDDLLESRVNISASDIGNIEAVTARITSGELVDEVIDTASVRGSDLKVFLQRVANVKARDLVNITDGELLDELLDCKDIDSSNVTVEEDDIGNVGTQRLVITRSALVDETVDAKDISRSSLKVTMRSMASFDGKQLSRSDGELIDEAVDGKMVRGNTSIVVSVSHVGKVSGKSRDDEIIGRMIDVDEAIGSASAASSGGP